MDLPVRRETVFFAAMVAVLGWWLLDSPPVQRAIATGAAVAVYVLASAAIERLRRRYLADRAPGDLEGGE